MATQTDDSQVLSDSYFEKMCALAEQRVSPKRFLHMQGVADTAVKLANTYNVSPEKARLAGILHDWDKNLSNEEVRNKVAKLGIADQVGTWVVQNMPQVLHGPTAAVSLGATYPELPQDVLSAIYKHTIAAVSMSDLDKAIYIADAIEPHRTFAEAPALRDMIGNVTLDELYFEVYRFWTQALLNTQGLLHPDTLTIWNAMVYPRAQARLAAFEQKKKEKKDT